MKILHTQNFYYLSVYSISNLFKKINFIFLFFILSNVCAAQIDTTGLLSHWALDETNGSKANDNIGNNSGLLVNSPTWQPTQGQLNGALDFDGKNDSIQLDPIDLSGTEMSLSFWFKADDFDTSDARFISKAKGTSGSSHYWMVSAINKTQLRFRLKTKGSTTTLISNPNVISTNQWYHVTATYDGNEMRIYRDGELVASTNKRGNIDTNSSVPVAIGNQPTNAGSKPFDGLMDDIRIYTVALNDSQIQSLIDDNPVQTNDEPPVTVENDTPVQTDSEPPVTVETDSTNIPSETGLLSHWLLDENNGSKANDSLKNNTGTLINSPTWHPTLGQFGGALEFDGTNDRVDLGALDIPGSEMSISFWFKADDFDVSDARFISKATGTSGNRHYWMVSASKKSKLRFRLKTNGSTTTLISRIGTISTGQWHHVTATYDGNKMKIYRDGELVASTAKTGKINTNNNIPVAIGNQPANAGSKPFDGLIDDVKIYTTALTIEQIHDVIEGNTNDNSTPPALVIAEEESEIQNEPPTANAGNNQTILVNQENDLGLITLSSKKSTDIDGTISSVEWRNENNVKLSTSTTMVTSLPVGVHAITLKVTDNEGASDTDSVKITINAESVATVDNVPPSISLTSPSNGGTTTGVVTVSTNASDNIDVVAVKFFLDGSQLNETDTSPPYAISWNTLQETNGTYTLVAKAYDAAGNVGTSSPVEGVINNATETNSSLITPKVSPARTNCVAPCSIFFDASGTTSDTTARPFHELNYSWNFDDANAGNWAWTGKSRNSATGAVATHIFESAGVHNVTLTVRDSEGNVATKQTAITIVDPDSFYSNTNTYCFSKSNDFSGCPTSLASQHITTNDIQVVENHVGSGKRLLLHRGDSWSTTSSIKLHGRGPSVLGAYGTCQSPDARGICANAPKLKITSSSANGVSSSFKNPIIDWRIMDIELIGPSGSSDAGFEARNDNQHILLLRMNIHDFHGLVKVDDSGKFDNGNITVADSSLRHGVGGKGGNGIWYSGSNMSIIGTEVKDATKIEHVIRTPYLNRAVISNNDLSDQAPTKVVLKLHGPEWSDTSKYSEKIVISDNKFKASDLSSVVWIVSIKPQSCTGSRDERIRDVVVERNLFQSGTYTQSALSVSARNITIRNNLFNMAKGQFQKGVLIKKCNQEPSPKDVGVINNSFYSAYTGEFRAISASSDGSNISVINNLAYAPKSNHPSLFSGADFAQSNLLMDSNGYVKSVPVNPGDFKLKASSPAVNSGTDTAKALLDFELRHRSSVDNIRDIGAFEQ